MKGNKPQWETEINKHWWILLTSTSHTQREESRDRILELYRKEIRRIIEIHIGNKDGK